MANRKDISNEKDKKELKDVLRKAFQSANVNFLIGSGCSDPAIKPLGDIEKEIDDLFKGGKKLDAEISLYDFLLPIAESNSKIMGSGFDDNTATTISNYKSFLHNIFNILIKRKSNILTKQATIFTTNYDLFIKKASEEFGSSLKLNDGFNRNPKLDNLFRFSVSEYFSAVYNKGNLYNYQVELPSINLIKLHGSLSWGRSGENIVFIIPDYLANVKGSLQEYAEENGFERMRQYIKDFNQQFNIILPDASKLNETLLDRVYYNLLRIYANELDKENSSYNHPILPFIVSIILFISSANG